MGFNSTMVRLEADRRCTSLQERAAFQFHNGSIRRFGYCLNSRQHSSFQFHNGSIRSQLEMISDNFIVRFNSTMVRLEVPKLEEERQRGFRFNSTMVRLEAIWICGNGGSAACFNSTMVRLEGIRGKWRFCINPKFQFHNGSIRSPLTI